MTTYNFKSGVTIKMDENLIHIIRTNGKSSVKALVAGRTFGEMFIKTASITGAVFNADFLLVCASGLPAPTDFKIASIADIKQYPNCIVGKQEELKVFYDDLIRFIQNNYLRECD